MTPGEYLKSLLEKHNTTAYRLSKETGLGQIKVSLILRGKRGITPATALKLATYFGNDPMHWMALQNEVDLEKERERIQDELHLITPHPRS